MNVISRISAAFAGVLLALSAQGAAAAPCAPVHMAGDLSGFSADASGAKRCETGSTNNDKIGKALQVNQDAIFGATPWTLLDKFNAEGGAEGDGFGGLISLGAGSTGLSGSFTIDESVRTAFNEIMVVLKGPAAFDYTAFLIADLAGLDDAGEYASVFYKDGKKGKDGTFQDISHLSFYGRNSFAGVVTTPVPAALPLLAGALGALALVRRRRG